MNRRTVSRNSSQNLLTLLSFWFIIPPGLSYFLFHFIVIHRIRSILSYKEFRIQSLTFGTYIVAKLKYWMAFMNFDIIDEISEIETIARGSGIRELNRLKKTYGSGNWKTMKGIAHIRLTSGKTKLAEHHWYEAHGIGKKEIKRKRYLE